MNKNIKRIILAFLLTAIICGLYFVSRYNYLFFHYIVEFATISIAVSIFVIALNTAYHTSDVFMFHVGTAFFTSALLDFLHTLAFKGQNIFPGFDANLPAQLWISARFVQVICLFVAPFILEKVITKRIKTVISIIFSLLFLILVSAIFIFKIFPVSYIDGNGVSLFGKAAEYIFSIMALAAIIIFYFKRKKLNKQIYLPILLSLVFFILSGLSFTLYVDAYGFFNILGHIFKLLSFYFIYRLFIETNLKNPFELIFNNLKNKNEQLQFVAAQDSLTGLNNQSAIFEKLEKQFEIAQRFNKSFSIIMLDIDDFKKINDSYGHIAGDDALKFIAEIIKMTVRDLDIKGRYGGDEFLICPIEVNELKAVEIAQKIQENLRLQQLPENCLFKKFTISAGISGIRTKRTFDHVMAAADKALLKSKKLGKDRVTLMK
jgi:diguanylate cyclase (GGDEF)-like protein